MTDAQKPMTFEESVEAAGKYLFYGRSVWTMKDMDEVTDYIRRLFRPLVAKQQTQIEVLLEDNMHQKIEGEKQDAMITELRDKLREVLDGWPTIKKQDKEIERLRALLLKYADHLESCRHRTISSDDYDSVYHCECGYSKIDYGSAALAEQPEGEKKETPGGRTIRLAKEGKLPPYFDGINKRKARPGQRGR